MPATMGKVVLRAYFTKTLYYSSSLFPLLSLFTEVKSCVTCPGTPSIVRVDLFLRAQIKRGTTLKRVPGSIKSKNLH